MVKKKPFKGRQSYDFPHRFPVYFIKYLNKARVIRHILNGSDKQVYFRWPMVLYVIHTDSIHFRVVRLHIHSALVNM